MFWVIEVGWWLAPPSPLSTRSNAPLIAGEAIRKLRYVCLFVLGVDCRVGEKALLDNDAWGRHHLLGGVVMALPMLPRLEHRGKPLDPVIGVGNINIVVAFPSSEAPSKLFVESLVRRRSL
jgi:hypothetical protein